ncbi:MAG: insulinase family protein [Flavobacteriales bacterium]|nr:insulinase family protein [Flavobacteriales bacterium]MCB9167886.1 insulinase family protein [Flavobacteriales bacterium]
MRTLTLSLASVMTTIAAQAQLREIQFTEFDLDNGLHVILHEDHSTPIVAVGVMYHVGSKNEPDDRRGFAHFFEHLLFEGSDNIARGEFSKYVEKAGGVLNANTTGDRTYYYEVLPSNQLDLGLWLESERMMHAKVDQKGIDTQREVVKEERRQRYENQPYGSILIEVLKRAYRKHPYRWPTIGYMEDLNAATEQDYVNFYKTFYVPNNAVLVVAGDVDPKEARKGVEAYFAPIPKGRAIVRPNIMEPAMDGEVRDVVHDQVQLPAVVEAYRIPAYGSPDFYAVDMLNRLLSQGNSSRLQTNVKDRQQKALYVGSFTLPLEDPGLSIAFAVANAGVPPDELEKAMDAEFAKVRDQIVSDAEFKRLRAQIETEFVTDNGRVAGIANNLASAYTFLGDASMINKEIERYMAVTPKDLQAAAMKYFVPSNRVVLHYLPKTQQQ